MKHATIKNYADALDYLKGKKSRPYAHNTRIETCDQGIEAKYHGNTVVLFTKEYSVYSSCGWRTSTTKERLNWFLPEGFSIYQERGVWYLVKRSLNEFGGYAAGERYVFADGLAIDASGNVHNAADDSENDRVKEITKTIKRYVDGYVKALIGGEVPAPSAGDCFYCVMRTESGESLGDATGDTRHLESHFEESYYVPSLLINAHKFSNRMSLMAQDGIARLWNGESLVGFHVSIVERDVKSTLTAYLKHAFEISR